MNVFSRGVLGPKLLLRIRSAPFLNIGETVFISPLPQEVAVNWREVPGSKLIRSKLDVITTSANMLRDMLCVKLCYLLGLWRVASSANAAELSRAMLKKTSKSSDPVLKKKA